MNQIQSMNQIATNRLAELGVPPVTYQFYLCRPANDCPFVVLCAHHALGVEERGGTIHRASNKPMPCSYCKPVEVA